MDQLTTIIILFLSGLCFISFAHNLWSYWFSGRKNRPRLAFATLGFAASTSILPLILFLHASSGVDVQFALKIYVALFIPLFLNLIWFLDLYAGYAYQRSWIFYSLAGSVLWVIHLFLPNGLITKAFMDFREIPLPWGETLQLSRLSPSVWAPLYYLFIGMGLIHVIRRGLRIYHSKDQWIGRILMACLVTGCLLAIHDFLLDFGFFHGFHLLEFMAPAIVIFMSMSFDLERNQQEAFYTELFDSLDDAVLVYDAHTCQIFRMNETAVRMFGFAKEELPGLSWEDFSAPNSIYNSKNAIRMIRQVYEKGPQTVEWLARRKNGSLLWVEVSLRAASVGGKDCMVSVVRDITERKRSQAALEESETKFRNIVEMSPMGMHFFKLEEGDKLVFEGANKAADQMLGMDHRRFVGMTLEATFPSLKLTEIPQRYRVAAKAGVSWHCENVEYRDEHIAGAYEVFAVQTKPNSMMALFSDISQRLRLEEERRRIQSRLQDTQRLESLGVLAGGIAHDFNNMLMTIRGSADELGSCSGVETHEVCKRSVELIQTVTTQAADLCRNLLSYAGRGMITSQPLDLRKVVEEVGRAVEARVTKKVRLDYRWADSLPLVNADANQIRQVVLNILMNATESFGKEAGRVTVSIQHRVLEIPELGLPSGNYLSLEVADNGSGMDSEAQELIFEPFFSTKFPSRGLGLAAVQGILRAHGGTIQVKSEPGHGTVMTVLLPVAKEKAPTSFQEAKSIMGKFMGRVLLVDDEPDVRRVTKRMLEKIGFSVDETEKGLEGVSMVRANGERYVAAVVDLSMPDLDGIEVLNRILVLRPNLPSILITGYGPEETHDRLLDLPGVVLLQKPFGREDLIWAVGKAGVAKDTSRGEEGTQLSQEAFKLDLARLIGTSKDIGDFYQDLSRLFIKLPGVRFSWVGLLGPDGVRVVPVVEVGEGGNYLRQSEFRADDSALGHGPTGEAIKSGEPHYVNDVAIEPNYAPWREETMKEGFASCAAVPIKISGRVVGALNFYSDQIGFFDEKRRAFLGDLSLLLAEGFRKFRDQSKDHKNTPG